MVLRAYLNAWLPIMGRYNGRIVFIDGFAGPGTYEGGEDGSPIIALKAYKEHYAKGLIRSEVIYLFIEEDPKRAEHLQKLVHRVVPDLGTKCVVGIESGNCVAALGRVLDRLDAEGQRLAPAFVMLDPFGVSGMPMSLVARVLKNPKAEMYISFMYESINRFKDSSEFAPHLDELFGTSNWRIGVAIEDSDERKQFFYGLYEQRLRAAGARHVVYFELFQGNRHIYTIFFATKHHVGCDRMKAAMWRADGSGSFSFRGQRGGQILLELGEPDFELLRRQLSEQFGRSTWVSVEDLTRWVQGDGTDFHEGHLKGALRQMERDGRIQVDEASRKRKGTYPDGTRLRFVSGDAKRRESR